MIVHQFERGVTFIGIVRYICCVLIIAAQIYLLYAFRRYVSFPTVQAARDLYIEFEANTFDDGLFSVDSWNGLDDDQRNGICSLPLANGFFMFVILNIWTAEVLKDVRQTLELCRAWLALAEPLSEGELANRCNEKVTIVRAPLKLKLTVMITLFIPKLIIAVVIWGVGCRWLFASDTYQDVILEAIALSFIFHTDELFYEAVEPFEVQEWVQGHSILHPRDYEIKNHPETDLPDQVASKLSIAKFFLALCINLGLTGLYLRFQRTIPNVDDVQAACYGYTSTHFPMPHWTL
jgi:hypothetical protein